MAGALAFLLLLLVSPAVYAQTTHTVGDGGGWNTGVDYDSWASSQNFTVGDILLFNYDFTHALDEVTQANYQNCRTSNSISSTTSSPTSITLSGPGTRYFICPRSNHCSQGMKLAVTTVGQGGSTTTAPPQSGGGSAPPAPRRSSASSLMAGYSLVFAGVLLGFVMG